MLAALHSNLATLPRQTAQLLAMLVLVMVIFVPLERLFAARRQRILRRAFWTDLGYFMIGGLTPNFFLIPLLSISVGTMHHFIPNGFYAAMAGIPGSVRLVLALVVGDIGYYWAHRWMHEVPFLWRFHAIHHRAEEMDWLVNTRAHPIDLVIGQLGGLIPIYALGLAQPSGQHVDMVPLLFALLGKLWSFFIHANLNWRLGWFEKLVSSPAFHHWHHTNDDPALIDKNYAAMLPWLDIAFGSFYLPRRLPERYGIAAKLPDDLTGQLLYPLQIKRAAGG